MHGVLDWAIVARMGVFFSPFVSVDSVPCCTCIPAVLGLLVMAAAAWMECLNPAGLSDQCAQALITAGYDDKITGVKMSDYSGWMAFWGDYGWTPNGGYKGLDCLRLRGAHRTKHHVSRFAGCLQGSKGTKFKV